MSESLPPHETIEDIFTSLRPKIDRHIASILPRAFSKDTVIELFGPPTYTYDLEGATKSLLTPIWDILDRGGKRWRPVLVILIAQALKGPEVDDDPLLSKTMLSIAYLCELVHNGSLVVDDIEDDSKMRRGKPCLHLTYGIDISVNAGNAMYFLPLNILRQMKHDGYPSDLVSKAYDIYSEEMIKLHLGQGLDIWWHSGVKDPMVQEYLQMCAYKTGTLARLSAKLAALVCGASQEQISVLGRFAESIGIAFQIHDDLLNIIGDKFSQKIAIQGEDIHEGKCTLMTIHCLANAPPDLGKRLKDILLMHTNDIELINEAIHILKSTKSIEYAQQIARDIMTQAWHEAECALPNDSNAKRQLKLFSDFLIERDF